MNHAEQYLYFSGVYCVIYPFANVVNNIYLTHNIMLDYEILSVRTCNVQRLPGIRVSARKNVCAQGNCSIFFSPTTRSKTIAEMKYDANAC